MAPLPHPRILSSTTRKDYGSPPGWRCAGGYRVEETADGRTALAKILSARDAGDPFDLVVTDIRMPEMSGSELIDALRERGTARGCARSPASATRPSSRSSPGKDAPRTWKNRSTRWSWWRGSACSWGGKG